MANKTQPTDLSLDAYLDAIEKADRRADCERLHALLHRVSGWDATLWGKSLQSAIVGYGHYHYKYESGREGDFFRVGFANRAQSLTIYIMPGYQDFSEELSRLGSHKTGKSCLYVKRLSDIDMDVLEEIVRKGLAVMAERYPL
ncbi:MAG: DUF1801 domain-containing protein [Litorimonas sp.]